MKTIPLTQGKFAIVDDEDFERVSKFKWYYTKSGGGYAARELWPSRKTQLMHRLIMGEPEGLEVDHRFGDGLDNRKENLRTATHQQNLCNRGKNKNNKSGFKGVHWSERRRRWVAQICVSMKVIYLGQFNKIEEAAEAYDAASLKHHGEFGRGQA